MPEEVINITASSAKEMVCLTRFLLLYIYWVSRPMGCWPPTIESSISMYLAWYDSYDTFIVETAWWLLVIWCLFGTRTSASVWLVACSAPSQYLYWRIANCTLSYKLLWNLNKKYKSLLSQKYVFQMAATHWCTFNTMVTEALPSVSTVLTKWLLHWTDCIWKYCIYNKL